MTKVTRKPLILGVGNILLSDEGVGVRAVEELEKFFQNQPRFANHFDFIDGGTCGMELLDEMANRPLIIIVDAILAGKPAGEIVVLRNEEVPTFFSRKISPHQLGICDVLSALKLTEEFPKQLCLIGVQPKSLEPNIGLSNCIQDALPSILDCVCKQLTHYGYIQG